MSWFSQLFSNPNDRYIRSLSPLVARINELEPAMQALSDAELKELTGKFRQRLASEQLDDLVPEAFAAVREASRRVSGKRHFDVQLMGGITLHQGKIAQMSTGEGKTLVATLPAYLNALEGNGVHVVTVNDYLSRRDATWMGQIYHALGMTVGVLNHDSSYRYDPSFAKASESEALDAERDAVGSFRVVHEFLRPVTRSEAYRADITYGTNNEFGFDYLRDNMVQDVSLMAQRPDQTHHFAIVDEVDSILIDEARTPLIISAPDEESGSLYSTLARVVPHLQGPDDYTVDEKLKTVSITDSGIEKVQLRLGIKDLYAEGSARQIHALEQALRAHVLFKLDRDYVVRNGEVVIVDEFTGRLMPGRRWSDGLHQAIEAKEGVAVQRESKTLATVTFQNYFRLYTKLAGMTGTARTSAEEFHKVYKRDVIVVPTNKPMIRADLPDRIYKSETGKFAALVREIKQRNETGQPVLVGTVSIQKNEMLSLMLARAGVRHQVLNAKNHEQEAEIIAQAGKLGAVTVATNMAGRGVDIILGGNPSSETEAAKVRELGGLAVFGTERHEARRIDDQLRGRAGRQGDPGASQFYVSCEDELVRIFGGDRLKNVMERLGVTDEDVIENRFVSRAIEQAQSRIEGHTFDQRKHVLEYDDVMNKHRETIYKLRREVLSADSNKERVMSWLMPEDQEAYEKHEQNIGAGQLRMIERAVILRVIDDIWIDHLDAMQELRDSVQLRAHGQRDPLVEYKIEAQRMYAGLLDAVADRVASIIMKVQVQPTSQRPINVQEARPLPESNLPGTAADEPRKPGRNDPCPCGSGKKYKKCHGA